VNNFDAPNVEISHLLDQIGLALIGVALVE